MVIVVVVVVVVKAFNLFNPLIMRGTDGCYDFEQDNLVSHTRHPETPHLPQHNTI